MAMKDPSWSASAVVSTPAFCGGSHGPFEERRGQHQAGAEACAIGEDRADRWRHDETADPAGVAAVAGGDRHGVSDRQTEALRRERADGHLLPAGRHGALDDR